MNKESNTYTIIFSIILIIVVASGLTLANVLLFPRQKKNQEIEKKSNILKSINIFCNRDSVEILYDKYIINNFVINSLGEKIENKNAFIINLKEELQKSAEKQIFPVFVAEDINGNIKYIFSLSGKGLWGEINGFVSTETDFNTIYGIVFNHASETPGLGDGIVERKFQSKFLGKKIFDDKLQFVDLKVIKNRKQENTKDVDALSGATLTSNGVQEMIKNCMSIYQKFIQQQNNTDALLRL